MTSRSLRCWLRASQPRINRVIRGAKGLAIVRSACIKCIVSVVTVLYYGILHPSLQRQDTTADFAAKSTADPSIEFCAIPDRSYLIPSGSERRSFETLTANSPHCLTEMKLLGISRLHGLSDDFCSRTLAYTSAIFMWKYICICISK